MTFTVTSAGTPASGAAVILSGSAAGAGTTNATGAVTLAVTATSNATVTATASMAGAIPATKVLVAKGDVNGDGTTNIVDTLFVAQFTVGIRADPTKP